MITEKACCRKETRRCRNHFDAIVRECAYISPLAVWICLYSNFARQMHVLRKVIQSRRFRSQPKTQKTRMYSFQLVITGNLSFILRYTAVSFQLDVSCELYRQLV